MTQANLRRLLLPLVLAVASVAALAQANSELTGIVTDQTGAVVPDAKIVLTDPATGFSKTTTSGATGLYDISGLNPANYNMKVTAKGFESFAQNGIVVNVSSTARADIKLTVGAEAETVTVEADALAVQADSNVVSTLISSEQISQIATENRNFAALAALGLGVSSALPDSNTPTSVAANFTISVNGLRQSHNIWLIDGGEADDRGGAGGMDIMPSQDAIAEFTMMTSNYPPDYGISSGATMSLVAQERHAEVPRRSVGVQPYARTTTPKNPIFADTPDQHPLQHLRLQRRRSDVHPQGVQRPTSRRPSSSGTKSGARFSPAPEPTNVPTLATRTDRSAGSDLTYVAPGLRQRAPA